MKNAQGPSPALLLGRLQLKDVTTGSASAAAFCRCAVEVSVRVKNEAGTWIRAVIPVGEAMEHGLRPGAPCAGRELEDDAPSTVSTTDCGAEELPFLAERNPSASARIAAV
jgi:hypothetical protein